MILGFYIYVSKKIFYWKMYFSWIKTICLFLKTNHFMYSLFKSKNQLTLKCNKNETNKKNIFRCLYPGWLNLSQNRLLDVTNLRLFSVLEKIFYPKRQPWFMRIQSFFKNWWEAIVKKNFITKKNDLKYYFS